MAATLAKIASDESCDGFRLGPDPFFLKFCSRLLTHNSEGHVPGCYIPVSYWKRLVDDPGVKGPRGGTVVYRHTLGRYFSPTSFTDMVAKGWIGTSALESSVVVPFLADALRGKKGIVLAIETSAPPGDDTEEDSPPKRRPPPKSQHPGKKAPTIQIKLRDPAWAVNTRCGRRRRRVRLQ